MVRRAGNAPGCVGNAQGGNVEDAGGGGARIGSVALLLETANDQIG